MSDDPTLPFEAPEPPEEWRPVVGYEGLYEGLYEVSSLGRVRSLSKRAQALCPAGVMKQRPGDEYGYLSVTLYRNGKTRPRLVHLLVLEAFVGPRPEGMVGRHGPLGHLVNRRGNLSWGTQAENIRDKERDGTKLFGETHHQAELTDEIVSECRRRGAAGESQAKLALEFGVNKGTMHRAVVGKTWTHLAEPPVAAKPVQASYDYRSKLTAEQVRDIRARHADGVRNCDLAAEFGISDGSMSSIIKRHTWKHVA